MDVDAQMRELLRSTRIAVVGAKDGEREDAFRIPRYLQGQGYEVVPVNPKLTSWPGEPALVPVARLGDIEGRIDLVNLFRAPQHIPAHVEEILALPEAPAGVWMQLGIHHGEASTRLRAAGIQVIQDRCIMVEHRRLLAERKRA